MTMIDFKCAFLHGILRRRVYTEPSERGPRSKGQQLMGRLVKA